MEGDNQSLESNGKNKVGVALWGHIEFFGAMVNPQTLSATTLADATCQFVWLHDCMCGVGYPVEKKMNKLCMFLVKHRKWGEAMPKRDRSLGQTHWPVVFELHVAILQKICSVLCYIKIIDIR